ncbi:MAG: hypothetical protein RI560_03480, partial [Natronomonas sp.]|nr:hypothetical protein [Natronomonas sp.]
PQPDEEMGFIEGCGDRGGEVVFEVSDGGSQLYCELDGEREYYSGELNATVENGTVSLDALPG